MTQFHRFRGLLQDGAPALLLVGSLGVAAWLYFQDEQHGAMVGFAVAVPETVAPTELARIASVAVSVGDTVTAGQVLATLDTSAIDAELAVAEADRARVEAAVRTTQTRVDQRAALELASLERDLAREREAQSMAVAETKALEAEAARIRKLVEEQQAVLSDLTLLDVRRVASAAVASEKPKTLGLLAKQIDAAEQRRQMAREEISAYAAKIDADMLLSQRKIEQLERRRAGYVLRATRPGRVASLDKQPGEVVAAGDPIVRLVNTDKPRVSACVPERMALGVREGDHAQLWTRGRRGASLSGKTVALGPLVTELPLRCWTNPKVPVWGREVTIALDEPFQLVAGQAFDIVLEPARSSAPTSAPMAPTSASAAPSNVSIRSEGSAPTTPTTLNGGSLAPRLTAYPRHMNLPAALTERTRFEPSGILARPGEGRYLVVSDDTGTGHGGDEGQPWLFAMSDSGVVDPTPIVVLGIKEFSDIESITSDESGHVYLLASQSFSAKGKRKPARTALLRLRVDAQGLRVDGEAHLAELLDADPLRAAALGLPDGTRALDIEGMTYSHGALYLGLKAPLDARGEASIWRIASPNALFGSTSSSSSAAGEVPRSADPRQKLSEAGFSLWAHTRLDVELGGAMVPGGISDLLFMPDGTLVLAATPSTAEGEAGALFRIDHSGPGALSARVVQRFPNLKPEGLSMSLSAGKLMVVFDAGKNVPWFEELTWAP